MPTHIFSLSLHDALPITRSGLRNRRHQADQVLPSLTNFALVAIAPSREKLHISVGRSNRGIEWLQDRKSTRLNSSHLVISYAVFCLIRISNQWYIAFDIH